MSGPSLSGEKRQAEHDLGPARRAAAGLNARVEAGPERECATTGARGAAARAHGAHVLS